MATPENIQQVRFIQGVNRTEDARITDAGSWYSTENLYGRSPGTLAKRPGSKLIVDGRTHYLGGNIEPPDAWSADISKFATGEVHLTNTTHFRMKNVGKTSFFTDLVDNRKGVRGIRPKINPLIPIGRTQMPESNNLSNVPWKRVAGLHRLYMDNGKRFWIGALDSEGGYHDRLFYITTAATPAIKLMSQEVVSDEGIITTSGADFFFLPARGGVPNADDLDDPEIGFWAIGTNQVDQPFAIKQDATGKPYPVSLEVGPYAEGSYPLNNSTLRLCAVQSLCMWGGQVVYGGYRMQTAEGTGPYDVYDHCIAFSDPGLVRQLAHNAGVINYLPVGESEAEPVTVVTTTAQPSDSTAQKSQLLVFTERRLKVYRGFPPISGDADGTDLTSNEFPIGCNSPRSVVRTPAGVVFFGSDGRFYLFAGGSPRPISAAVQDTFIDLTPRQQKQCAAIYDASAGYYKFSYPDVHASSGSGNYRSGIDGRWSAFRADYDIPDRQAWADMRQLSGDSPDMGVRWFLPMVGMKHSCMAVADGAEDHNEIYAGSAIDGSIFQVGLGEYTTDPTPENPTATTNILAVGVTGLFDLGDAHVDKTITALSYGFGADRSCTIRTSIIVNADNQALAQQQTFSRTVTPTADLIGSTFVLGTSSLSSPDAFELFTERSATRMRGKTFRFTFEELTGNARLFFSDISFRAIVAQRRI